MRRDLLTKQKNFIPGNPSIIIDHTCIFSPNGLLQDHLENIYEYSESLFQTSFGITGGGSIDFLSKVTSISNFSFQISIKIGDFFSEYVPISLGDGMNIHLYKGNFSIRDGENEIISLYSGKDFFLNIRYGEGMLEIFLDGKKIFTNISSPPRSFSPSFTFPLGMFMDNFFFYDYVISNQIQASLLSSVFRKSSFEVIQMF